MFGFDFFFGLLLLGTSGAIEGYEERKNEENLPLQKQKPRLPLEKLNQNER